MRSSFGPFGPGNMQPTFVSRSVVDSGYARTLGSGGDHLKINLWDSAKATAIEGIGFNLGHHYSAISSGASFDMLYTIEENHFRGTTKLQVNIKDIQPL
jgi:single-stranded-DNA-specific exonuclease